METITTQSATRSLNKGYSIALVGILLWSTTAIFISYLLTHYDLEPLTLAFWRNIFVSIFLMIIFFFARRDLLRIEARHRRLLIVYGLSLSLLNIMWTYSVLYNGAAVSTVLVYSSPIFTALVASIVFGERLTLLRIGAILASLIGCVLVSGAYDPQAWSLNAVGIVIGITSGLGFTLYSMLGKLSAQRGVNSWTATLAAFAISAIVLLPTQLGGAMFTLGRALDGWAILFILAIIPTLGGFGLYTASLGYLPAGTANLIATLEPALTAVLAFLLLQESLDPLQVAGSVLILGSVVSLRRSDS